MRLPGKVGELVASYLRCRLLVFLLSSWGDLTRARFVWGAQSRKLTMAALLMLMPLSTAYASANVARAVETFCAPQPTQPPVSSCATCHSSSDNRGLNDLTVSGQWSISSATYSRFCPAIVSETPARPTSTTPALGSLPSKSSSSIPVFGLGGRLSHGTRGGIGMGRGAVLTEQP